MQLLIISVLIVELFMIPLNIYVYISDMNSATSDLISQSINFNVNKLNFKEWIFAIRLIFLNFY